MFRTTVETVSWLGTYVSRALKNYATLLTLVVGRLVRTSASGKTPFAYL